MVLFSIIICFISSKSSFPKIEVQYIASSVLSSDISGDIPAAVVIIIRRKGYN